MTKIKFKVLQFIGNDFPKKDGIVTLECDEHGIPKEYFYRRRLAEGLLEKESSKKKSPTKKEDVKKESK